MATYSQTFSAMPDQINCF